ncbi:hypothetical protein HD806DRAFT_549420 [Xylariaceae sp. AK1471]|nr:hypothetical protein HD806DRAFT_549420 [Xylariaceae sp. AK1471]
MEAIAAVSFTGTICSLVGFSAGFISQSWHLHRALVEARTRHTDLEQLASVLNEEVSILKAEQALTTGSGDDSIQVLSDRATAATSQLIELLGSCTVQDGRHGGQHLKAGFKNAIQREPIKELHQKLDSLLIEAKTHRSLLISKRSFQQVLMLEDELKDIFKRHWQDIKALVSQGSKMPKEYGYEWEQAGHIVVDDGLGARFPFPIYLCSNIVDFLQVMRIKYKSRDLPGRSQFANGHVEIFDSTGTRVINKNNWATEVTVGKVLQMAFVMGRCHCLPRSKCPRCYKPYKRGVSNTGWKECLSCKLTLHLVPPEVYPFQPKNIVVGMSPDTYRDYRAGRSQQSHSRLGPNSSEFNAAPCQGSNSSETKVRESKTNSAIEGNIEIDLVCRRMIVKWEPTINVVHRYLHCRCVIRLSTPSRYNQHEEITIFFVGACPRHNDQGVKYSDYGDLVDNHADPYFDRFGGYNCFRALLHSSICSSLKYLGGDAFVHHDEIGELFEELKVAIRERASEIHEAWRRYCFEVKTQLTRNGVPLPDELKTWVNAHIDQENETSKEEASPALQSLDINSERLDRIPGPQSCHDVMTEGILKIVNGKSYYNIMTKEVFKIVNGEWDGVPHWSIRA